MNRASSSEKPLHWVGSSKKDLLAFPEEVIDDIGYALGVVQLGGTPPSAKPWKGEGPSVLEIVEDFRGDAYRAVYTVRFKEAVYVLHCFQKKSPSGISTARSDTGLIHERLKAAQVDYEVRYGKKA
jgi:phage-related protein